MKAIIEDDLPYSFEEKPGIQKCFSYILPKGYPIPKHQTVRHDLDLLHSEMNSCISLILSVNCHGTDSHNLTDFVLVQQVQASFFKFSSDLWMSKNSVYAFIGSVVYWIDHEWKLYECPLELLPLDGDHSGKVSGKLLFNALKHRNIVTKISTCRPYFCASI